MANPTPRDPHMYGDVSSKNLQSQHTLLIYNRQWYGQLYTEGSPHVWRRLLKEPAKSTHILTFTTDSDMANPTPRDPHMYGDVSSKNLQSQHTFWHLQQTVIWPILHRGIPTCMATSPQRTCKVNTHSDIYNRQWYGQSYTEGSPHVWRRLLKEPAKSTNITHPVYVDCLQPLCKLEPDYNFHQLS